MLGRLEKVELRDVWQSEAQHFTPWLAKEDNLKLLGDTIGIDLELEAVEKKIGDRRNMYRIVAKVDELMALCNKLKDCLNEAQTTQIQLADTIVEKAVA